MAGQNFCVIVGVNHSPASPDLPSLDYAEADAQALHAALTDRHAGQFKPENSDLLIGPMAAHQNIKRTLRRRVRAMSDEDFLLVYFSGHGFVPEWSPADELFLATTDLNLTLLDEDPDSALRSSFLRRDIFEEISGSSLLILDACFSAKFQEPATLTLLPPTYRGRHAALLGYSDDGTARENHQVQHGEFTHDLLQGLAGGAVAMTGEVTIESLYSWLVRSGTKNPLYDARNWNLRIPLTKPVNRRTETLAGGSTDKWLETVTEVSTPLDSNHLALRTFIARLLDGAFEAITDPDTLSRHKLHIVMQTLGADLAGTARTRSGSLTLRTWTDRSAMEALAPSLMTLASTALEKKRSSVAFLATTSKGFLVVIPTRYWDDGVEFFVAVNPDIGDVAISEPIALVVRAFLHSDVKLDISLRGLELRIISELRQVYGRLPVELYEHAFHLYRQEIKNLATKFERIVGLGSDGSCTGVRSFEALARRTVSDKSAPGALLALSNLWGDRFTIERDLLIAQTALTTYRSAQDESSGHGSIPPVSINVAVRSLFSPGYLKSLQDSMLRNRLEGYVTLEISEQDEVVLPDQMEAVSSPMEEFRRHLVTVAQDLEVRFAIDDFGVGHSSLDRLAALSLTQIKIDRSILKHPRRLEEIELIMKIAQETLLDRGVDSRSVVLEGIDENILGSGSPPLTLRILYEKGIRHIQGYITGEESTIDLRTSRQELTQRLQKHW